MDRKKKPHLQSRNVPTFTHSTFYNITIIILQFIGYNYNTGIIIIIRTVSHPLEVFINMSISRDARNTKTPQNSYYTTDKITANLTDAVLFGITRRTSVVTPRVTD